MKTLRIFFRRNWVWVSLILIGIALWWVSTITIGEAYATVVGPDFLIKIGVGFVRLGVAWCLQRILMRSHFTTVWEYCAQGSKPESDFRRDWETDRTSPHITRAIATYLGTWMISAAISLFAA